MFFASKQTGKVMVVGKVLSYGGTDYLIKEETETAIAVGENSDQIVWVTKQWIIDQGFGVLIGRSPAWVCL